MPNVTIYTWQVCPFCVRAKNLLQRKNIPYTEINLDGKDDELKKLQERTHFKTIPQIFIKDQFIGGYTELAELENAGKLDQMVAG